MKLFKDKIRAGTHFDKRDETYLIPTISYSRHKGIGIWDKNDIFYEAKVISLSLYFLIFRISFNLCIRGNVTVPAKGKVSKLISDYFLSSEK